ncbi:MAG: hypothetical protein RIS90_2894 [Pseudomonadota bacterium]|jgi:hypothetical protein
MNPLQTELNRLYLAPEGQVRALVLALARPADWSLLAPLWRGVQTDLALPAPAIAVSGVDSYQLWFSLAEPVPALEGALFLEALRQHYLGTVTASRISLAPSPAALGAQPTLPVPGQQQGASGHWSAFVAPDLAPIFADEPWLDQPPSPEAQASVLARLQSIKPAALAAALARLRPAAPSDRPPEPVAAGPQLTPKAFLLAVMQDPTVALDLRMEAAKALLPYVEG